MLLVVLRPNLTLLFYIQYLKILVDKKASYNQFLVILPSQKKIIFFSRYLNFEFLFSEKNVVRRDFLSKTKNINMIIIYTMITEKWFIHSTFHTDVRNNQ